MWNMWNNVCRKLNVRDTERLTDVAALGLSFTKALLLRNYFQDNDQHLAKFWDKIKPFITFYKLNVY